MTAPFIRVGSTYRTTETLTFQHGAGVNIVTMIVPRGFAFDVSVPRPVRWLFDPHDPRFLRAAALHDYALHRLDWPREIAAAPFGESLRRDGVSRVKRLAMVLAVIVNKWR